VTFKLFSVSGLARVVRPAVRGFLVTGACPVPREDRSRLRGARGGTAYPPRLPDPLIVTRRVPARGAIMRGGQKIQVGLAHARKTAEVTVEPTPT
jgi:hypothetical protein